MNDVIETNEIIEPAKPYTFRRLSAEDMFLMFRIIGKIGVKEFKNCFENEGITKLSNLFKESGNDEKVLIAAGVTVGLDVADVIFANLPKAEKEIYMLLAQVSGLSVDEIKADAIVFTEMIIDFVKKPEFPDFIKVVSKLFK